MSKTASVVHKKRRRSKKTRDIRNNSFHASTETNIDGKELNTALADHSEDVEYVIPELDLPPDSEFAAIFEMFKPKIYDPNQTNTDEDFEFSENDADNQNEKSADDGDLDALNPEKMSKKQLKKLCRMTVAQLKQLVKRPEVVEFEDTTAPDPLFLVTCKYIRNSVPVPPHWSAKRKYLAGKRGFLKPPFELPEYIKSTGVTEQRNLLKEREESMSLKAKSREKMNPRMGKLNLDYEKLYDAFFKHQTKPEMTAIGDIYYEGKEYELRQKDKKPGVISEDLRSALGIPPLAPPPWLYNMQRFGPPPSYVYLKIPGLNAPIPEGAQWGFHPGGWGKPPVDEFNRPLYGDVYGLSLYTNNAFDSSDASFQQRWGEPEPDDEPVLPSLDDAQDALYPPPPPTDESFDAVEDFHQDPSASRHSLVHDEEDGPTVVHQEVAIPPQSSSFDYVDVSEDHKTLFTVLPEVLPEKNVPKSTFAITQKLYDVASLIKTSAPPASYSETATTSNNAEQVISLEKRPNSVPEDKKSSKPKKSFKF